MNHQSRYQTGYSLIEISIVVTIVGSLIAGVIAGMNLYKQAILRSIILDMSGYAAAYNNFVSRFSKIPGDIDTAYNFWGTKCGSVATNCDGNNDGIIQSSTTSLTTDESLKAWNHLYNASIISVNILPVTTLVRTVGGNVPASRIAGAGYTISQITTTPSTYSSDYNVVFIGKLDNSTGLLTAGTLNGGDTFFMDQKIDDGGLNASNNPIGAVTGNWRAVDGTSSTMGACVSNTTTGVYNIADTNSSCSLGTILNIG